MRILEEYIEKYAGDCRVDFYSELTRHLQDGTYKLPKQIFDKLLCHPSVRSGNNCNALRRKDNSSGIKGINWHKATNKWMCRVQHEGNRIILGYFNSLEEAKEVLTEYRESVHGEFTNHGDKYEQF